MNEPTIERINALPRWARNYIQKKEVEAANLRTLQETHLTILRRLVFSAEAKLISEKHRVIDEARQAIEAAKP